MICKICNKEIKNENALSKHIRLKHNIDIVQYYVKFNNFKIPKCPYCNKDRMRRKNLDFNQTCGDKLCVSKNRSKKNKELLENGMREKISISMKKAHSEGRAWNIGKSRWNNEPSYPEKFFIQVIENEFDDKHYIREYNVGKYSIDFAWIYKKIAIEIDGDQHYRFKEYKERDIKKDKYCNNFINNGSFTIDEQKITVDYKILKRKLNNDQLINVKSHNNRKCNKNNVNLKIDKIKNSNIDFSKRGWVSEVSKILEISPQKVTQWMRKNMYEFWDENCFKRKGTKTNN